MKTIRVVLISLAVVVAVVVAVLWSLGRGAGGGFDSALMPALAPERPAESVAKVASAQRAASNAVGAMTGKRQILFGDLHVHTTISFDAFMMNLPAMGGTGATPPADACDFARHCAALDFWSINDHASNIHPEDWKNTVESIRQCNASSGDPANPDTVAFLGWEWTQAGDTPENHYGHKNVVLRHTDDERIPTRPIAATFGGTAANPPPTLARGLLAAQDQRYRDLAARWTVIPETEICSAGKVRDLPNDCIELAPTPADLFRKLDDWGHDAIVIPHGTTWGIYTPPTSSWDKQLKGEMHDPNRQTLIEMYSGHGANEVYRNWRPAERDQDGNFVCPEISESFVPMCQRAAQIVIERCLADGESQQECSERAEQARINAVNARQSPHLTVAGTTGADWMDSGQCSDCAQPAFKYRPRGSAQYIAAIGDFSENPDDPRRFRMGFIGSSDIHTAKPGTGYKELRALSETRDLVRPTDGGIVASFLSSEPEAPESRSRTYADAKKIVSGLQLYESERVRSFLYTGGLIAAHSDGRDSESIWASMERKEVYGTSGPRILLWFDMLGEDGTHPMGSETETRDAPIFRVRAVGSFEQAPGCPESAHAALGEDRLAQLCLGECYRPTDVRRQIERIEIIRIRPQMSADEDVASLIEDPWQSFECPDDPSGCVATFVDPEFSEAGRDTVYYARVLEEPSPTVNGGDPMNCDRNADGRCVKSHMCEQGSDCTRNHAQRAWSSPIYVDYQR